MQHRRYLISGAISAALFVALAACRFPYSLTSGGLDRSLKTMAVLPFENKTTTPGIERELAELLSSELRSRLGKKESPEATADIVVSGIITKYDVDIPVAFSADPTRAAGTRRKLEVSIEITVTNTRANTKILDRKTFQGPGEYAESAEQAGRKDALVKIVQQIVQGVQSNW